MSEDHVKTDSGLRADGTAAALIAAAIEIFGRKGFESTSTREIAAAARTNIASISYYFGGKAGLRRACAETFATDVGTMIETLTAREPTTAPEAEAMLVTLIERLAHHLIGAKDMRPLVPFVLREISDGSPNLDLIYTTMIGPSHQRLCRIWALATGEDAEADAVKIFLFSLIGQIVYFRIGTTIVMRRMGWAELGPGETAQIVHVLKANLSDLIAARRRFPQ